MRGPPTSVWVLLELFELQLGEMGNGSGMMGTTQLGDHVRNPRVNRRSEHMVNGLLPILVQAQPLGLAGFQSIKLALQQVDAFLAHEVLVRNQREVHSIVAIRVCVGCKRHEEIWPIMTSSDTEGGLDEASTAILYRVFTVARSDETKTGHLPTRGNEKAL
jgi:hypothetical protein